MKSLKRSLRYFESQKEIGKTITEKVSNAIGIESQKEIGKDRRWREGYLDRERISKRDWKEKKIIYSEHFIRNLKKRLESYRIHGHIFVSIWISKRDWKVSSSGSSIMILYESQKEIGKKVWTPFVRIYFFFVEITKLAVSVRMSA